MPVHHIILGSWPSRLDTIDLRFKSVLIGVLNEMRIKVEESSEDTLSSQIDRIGIESSVALRGGKAHDERGKQESKRQHVDLLVDGVSDECLMQMMLMMILFDVIE